MKPRTRTHLIGVILIILIVLLGFFLLINAYIYKDIKKVNQDVYNLYQQVRTNNSKIDKFSAAEDDLAKQSAQFTEATKNWQMQENSEFNFQLKNPASWGNLKFVAQAEARVNQGLGFAGQFENNKERLILVEYYDFLPAQQYRYADENVFQALIVNDVGECGNQIFTALKALNVGEIRNCFVRENILQQKFLVYRYVRDGREPESNLLAVYPRPHNYVRIPLAEGITSELDYFIQSVVFMK